MPKGFSNEILQFGGFWGLAIHQSYLFASGNTTFAKLPGKLIENEGDDVHENLGELVWAQHDEYSEETL